MPASGSHNAAIPNSQITGSRYKADISGVALATSIPFARAQLV
jgi:hypothetical protein